MADRTLVLSSGDRSSGGRTIVEEFFGGNFLFDRDRVGEEGTFDEKAAALDIDFIRYPGGAIAEESFSLRWPDRTQDPAMGGKELLPLSEFVNYVSDIEAEYSLVVPTKIYMQALLSGDMTGNQVRREMKQFAKRLAEGEFGDKLPKIIEVGNEFYTFEGADGVLEAKLYARVAKLFAEEIRAELGGSVEIGIQGGTTIYANDAIADHFAHSDRLVDKVIYHSYPWTVDEIWTHQDQRGELARKWLKSGVAEGVFFSEFNISNQHKLKNGEKIDQRLQETGMAKAVALVELTADMIKSGVDYAAVWPIQQRTNGDLAGNEGETRGDKLSDSGLTLTGEAFKLVSESVVGKKLISSKRWDIDGDKEADRDKKEVLIHAFEDADEIVVFISAWNLSKSQRGFAVDLDLGGDFSSATVTRLYTNGPAYDSDAAPIVEEEVSQIRSVGDVSVTLHSRYEVVRLTLKKQPFKDGDAKANLIVGSEDNDEIFGAGGDDTMIGAEGGDTIEGQRHDDILKGMGGADILKGQHGADDARGGAGDDSLIGGSGADTLSGGAGADRIAGNGGRDILLGGRGSDKLIGGLGQDKLAGGRGDDLALGGAQNDRLFGGLGEDTLIGGAGDDLLDGGDRNDSLVGSGGDDSLSGGLGGDTLDGGDGDDTLLGAGGDDAIVTGNGNDLADGGAGDDLITSFSGNDVLSGGMGSDTFHFAETESERRVVIRDFKASEDQIAIEGEALQVENIVFSGNAAGDAVITVGALEVTLEGTSTDDVSAANLRLAKKGEIAEGPDAVLTRGEISDAVLGHKYNGAQAPDGRATVSFTSDGGDALLNFRSFDMDVTNEVEVLLNGRHFGFIEKVGNEVHSFHSLSFGADELAAGENTITFVETLDAVTTWGIDQLLIA